MVTCDGDLCLHTVYLCHLCSHGCLEQHRLYYSTVARSGSCEMNPSLSEEENECLWTEKVASSLNRWPSEKFGETRTSSGTNLSGRFSCFGNFRNILCSTDTRLAPPLLRRLIASCARSERTCYCGVGSKSMRYVQCNFSAERVRQETMEWSDKGSSLLVWVWAVCGGP